jgi:hypothetical protein
MSTRRMVALLLLAGTVLLGQVVLVAVSAQEKPRTVDDEVNYTNYIVLRNETPYYANGPQQGRAPDGKFTPGTKVRLLRRSGSYSLVQTAEGKRVYVSADVLQPAGDAEGKDRPQGDLSGRQRGGAGRRNVPEDANQKQLPAGAVKVAVFRNAGSATNPALSRNKPSDNSPPKPLSMAAKISLIKSSGVPSEMVNTVEEQHNANLYSKLTPAQPSDGKGYLRHLYSGCVEAGSFYEDLKNGNAFFSGTNPLMGQEINLHTQPNRLYVFDLSVGTIPQNKPMAIYAGNLKQVLTPVDGHCLVVVQASGDELHLFIQPESAPNQENVAQWRFYSCEVTEHQ